MGLGLYLMYRFWFAGLGGMLLESKWMRRVMSNISGRSTGAQVEPVSYSFSFNPLPALVIAVVSTILPIVSFRRLTFLDGTSYGRTSPELRETVPTFNCDCF
jgi:hypothetical protein